MKRVNCTARLINTGGQRGYQKDKPSIGLVMSWLLLGAAVVGLSINALCIWDKAQERQLQQRAIIAAAEKEQEERQQALAEAKREQAERQQALVEMERRIGEIAEEAVVTARLAAAEEELEQAARKRAKAIFQTVAHERDVQAAKEELRLIAKENKAKLDADRVATVMKIRQAESNMSEMANDIAPGPDFIPAVLTRRMPELPRKDSRFEARALLVRHKEQIQQLVNDAEVRLKCLEESKELAAAKLRKLQPRTLDYFRLGQYIADIEIYTREQKQTLAELELRLKRLERY